MEKPGRNIITIMFLIIILMLINLFYILLRLDGRFFLIEAGAMALLLIIALIVFFRLNSGKKVWASSIIFFALGLGNWLYLYMNGGGFKNLSFILFLSLLGMVISMIKLPCRRNENEKYNEPDKKKPANVETYYEPGKYVASSSGKKYHVAKCDWAKKINPKRRFWFDSKEEAEKKGFKACECIN